jgi:hypothetical protein
MTSRARDAETFASSLVLFHRDAVLGSTYLHFNQQTRKEDKRGEQEENSLRLFFSVGCLDFYQVTLVQHLSAVE